MYRVLIADDELMVVSSLKKRVKWEQYGFEIIAEANNGIEAYEKILELHPDIVFTDIRMPGMSGLELIRKVYELSLNIYFVVISGYAEFDYAQKAVNFGALGYCLKPFERDELGIVLARVKAVLDKDKVAYDNELCREQLVPGTFPEDETGNETYLKVLKYVNANYCRDITVQSVANIFFINPNYISQLFKRKKGETFTEYLTSLRMKRACSMLKASAVAVHEVADSVGYRDYFYFAKVFKKATGMTPKEYRDSDAVK